jgi:phosphoglycerate dehydrogenase-like enzyme
MSVRKLGARCVCAVRGADDASELAAYWRRAVASTCALTRRFVRYSRLVLICAWFRSGRGLDNIDLGSPRGMVLVCNTRANAIAVAEHAVALMPAVARVADRPRMRAGHLAARNARRCSKTSVF